MLFIYRAAQFKMIFLITSFQVTCGDFEVILTAVTSSFSIHHEDFRVKEPMILKTRDCQRCSLDLRIGVHFVDSKDNVFPLDVNGKPGDATSRSLNFASTSNVQYNSFSLDLDGFVTNRISISKDHRNVVFAITVYLIEFVNVDNVFSFDVETSLDRVRFGNSMETYGVYLVAVARQGNYIKHKDFQYWAADPQKPTLVDYNPLTCRFDIFAGTLPSHNDSTHMVFTLPRLTDVSPEMLWRVSTITLKLAYEQCHGQSWLTSFDPKDDPQHVDFINPSVFGDHSHNYPGSSKLPASRSYSFAGDETVESPRLIILIENLQNGVLTINFDNDTYISIIEGAPFVYCNIYARNFTTDWLPNNDENSSSFLVSFRATSPNIWFPECDQGIEKLATKKPDPLINKKPSRRLFEILPPIFAFITVAATVMIIVDYYRKVTSLKRSLLEKRQLVDSWAIDSAFLVIGKKIGQGSFAEVFQALYFAQLPCTIMQPEIKQDFPSPDEGIMVAVKYAARESEREVLLKEIKIMKSIGYHPHLLSLLGCSEDPIKPLILTEFCTNGDLLTALRSADLSKTTPRVVELSFEDLHRIAWEVASALEFLISRDVIHRDVAARNVLINGAKASKLCDFGLSRDFSNSYYTHHGGKIPVKWTSLEAIECGIYTEASDVWAFGVLLWEMYSHGATPYGDMDADTMLDELKKGFRLEKPQSMPTQIAIIMARCWTTALSRRPNFKEITQGLREFLAIHYH